MPGYKKQRGLRRYYRNLAVRNDFETRYANLLERLQDPDAWFDARHFHFDKRGYGNNCFKRRKPHLDKLFRHFDMLIESAQGLQREFQLFAFVFDRYSKDDAVCLHTPNRNNIPFPMKWEHLSEESTLRNKELIEYIGRLPQYDKLYGTGSEPFCILIGSAGLDKASYRAENGSLE